MHFLRMMTGNGKSCVDVMLRKVHRAPVMHHWVVLAACQWAKLAAMPLDQPSMAREAWLSDIAVMRGVKQAVTCTPSVGRIDSCVPCSRLARSLRPTGTPLRTLQLCSLKKTTKRAVWQPACMLGGHQFCLAPSAGLEKVVHANWVYVVSPDVDCTDTQSAPPHMVCKTIVQCMP